MIEIIGDNKRRTKYDPDLAERVNREVEEQERRRKIDDKLKKEVKQENKKIEIPNCDEILYYALFSDKGLDLPNINEKPKAAIYQLNPNGKSIEDDILVNTRDFPVNDLIIIDNNYLHDARRYGISQTRDDNGKIIYRIYQTTDEKGHIINKKIRDNLPGKITRLYAVHLRGF